jgi:hypothetical protein
MAMLPAVLAFPGTVDAKQPTTARINCDSPVNIEIQIGPIDIRVDGTLDCDDHDHGD